MKLQIPAKFKLNTKKIHLVILGTGGTGGYLIPNILRVVSEMIKKGTYETKITFIDKDVVENKNVGRQNFFHVDIGKGKANVMASRYGKLFGLEIATVEEYIENEKMFKDTVFMDGYLPILVGCVDNNATRKLIHKMFLKYPEKFVWLDAGNVEYGGQVVLGYNSPIRLTETNKANGMFRLPSVCEIFEKVLQDTESKFASEVSCAELAVNNVQNIAANITSADKLFVILNQLLAGDMSVDTFYIHFDGKTGGANSHATTYEELKPLYEKIDTNKVLKDFAK